MMFFVLVCMLLMIFTGGMAIDIMRYESDRMKIQAVADSAVLAAASMRRDVDAQVIVEDWFEKAGLPHALVNVRADDQGLNFRDVYVETRTTTRPYFMQMMGVDLLDSAGEGRAVETRSNVEISLVLDVSGSMLEHNRSANLKTAAKEFISEILTPENVERTFINVVPYNGQVMLSDAMWMRHNVSYAHNRPDAATARQCLDFPQTAYNSVSVSRTTPYPQSAYADTFQWTYSEDYYPLTPNYVQAPQAIDTGVIWCTGAKANAIRLGSANATSLNSTIDNLVFTGATSIDLGFKWGASLLDPASRGLFSSLADPQFTSRPSEYNDPMTLKVVVLMTDGEHFEQEIVNDAYRTNDLSPIYRYGTGSNTRYLIHHPDRVGSNKYYFPAASAWYSSANALGSATQMRWNDLFATVRMKWVAWQLYARPFATSDRDRENRFRAQMNVFRTSVPRADMDARLLGLCRQMRDRNVVIFGIAFEAPSAGANVIRNCASPGRFYDVVGLDIRTAFRAIRMQIQALRLTQ